MKTRVASQLFRLQVQALEVRCQPSATSFQLGVDDSAYWQGPYVKRPDLAEQSTVTLKSH